jgi:predicted metal-dependent hydrolase
LKFEVNCRIHTLGRLSKKSAKIAGLIERCQGQPHDAHYLGYFECFNQQLFYEAHDVLEELWLGQRHGPNDGFYKGLIQFAGAFVHLQKNRLGPAAALFKLSRKYLAAYPARHEDLDLERVHTLINEWVGKLEGSNFLENPLLLENPPQLRLSTFQSPAV